MAAGAGHTAHWGAEEGQAGGWGTAAGLAAAGSAAGGPAAGCLAAAWLAAAWLTATWLAAALGTTTLHGVRGCRICLVCKKVAWMLWKPSYPVVLLYPVEGMQW